MINFFKKEDIDLKNNNTNELQRLKKRNWFVNLVSRPEIGPFSVMILILLALGIFSIPENVNSWNPFDGEGFNALGIRNNTRLIAQLGIIALGAGLLIVAGEFDLSIGSMIGFAGMCMAVMLKWGFYIVLPYISFQNGFSIETITILSLPDVSPIMAFLITLIFTLFFGWLIGFIVTQTGLASFIVSLSFLFFLRGLTEVCYRAFNKSPDQTAGSTQVSNLPDIKNIIFLSGHGEIERDKAKILPSSDLMELFKMIPDKTVLVLKEKLNLINERVALRKTEILEQKAIASIERDLNNAIQSGNKNLANTLQGKLDSGVDIQPVVAKSVTELDIVKAWIDTIDTARPVADFFGGNILEGIFEWFYTIGWNVNNYGNQFAPGLYSAFMIWLLIAVAAYLVLSRTQAGNWIYSTGGNLNAAKANGVPTSKVKISLFMFSAFCATVFAATQVFETNTADAAKGNLKELEAIAAAVIGGVVLTGGFGTVVGIMFGAVIFGIAREAFFYIPYVDGSFYRVFLGFVLLSAALTNENIRKRITGGI